AVFVPATLAELANDSADPDKELGLWASIKPGDMWSFVTDTPDGHLWGIRLLLTVLAAALIVPPAIGALSGKGERRPRLLDRIVPLALAAGTGELIFRVVPAEKPEEWVREIFTQALDFGHMLGAAVWIGGIVALAITAATLRLPAEQRGRFWSIALRRF